MYASFALTRFVYVSVTSMNTRIFSKSLFISVLVIAALASASPTLARGMNHGDRPLLSCDESKAVYELQDDGSIRSFATEKLFYSYYKSFDALKSVSCEELRAYQMGPQIRYTELAGLFKHESRPDVYAIDLDYMTLRGNRIEHLQDEQSARVHFGPEWQKKIVVYSNEKWKREMTGIYVDAGYAKEIMLVKSKRSPDVFVLNGTQKDTYVLENEKQAEERFGKDWNQLVAEIGDEHLESLRAMLVPLEETEDPKTSEQSVNRSTPERVPTTQAPVAVHSVAREVKGRVIDAVSGLPVVGVTAAVSGSSIHAVTDTNGEFVLTYSSGVEYRQVSIATSRWYKPSQVKTMFVGDSVVFSLEPARADRNYGLEHPVVSYQPSSNGGVQLSGYVYDAVTGESVPNASVVASHGSISGRTDASGYFVTRATRGTHRLYVMYRDAQQRQKIVPVYYQVNLAQGSRAEVILTIER